MRSLREMMSMLEDEEPGDKLTLWELVEHYGLDSDLKGEMSDDLIGWVNHNKVMPINRWMKDPQARLLSKIILYRDLSSKGHWGGGYSEPWISVQEFEAALQAPITVWRGGGGEYDPNYTTKRRWTSFTTKKERSVTFSEYDGTYASRSYMLPKRSTWWVVELQMKLDDILLYVFPGMDHEVIVPVALARQAKVISTHLGQPSDI